MTVDETPVAIEAPKLHEFRYRKNRMGRGADPAKVNLCEECDGYATEKQHGGQFSNGPRPAPGNTLGSMASCGWCDWLGPVRSQGGNINWVSAMVERDGNRHIDKMHPDGPPATAVFSSRLPKE